MAEQLESELGLRLEAALGAVEQRTELLALVVPGVRQAIVAGMRRLDESLEGPEPEQVYWLPASVRWAGARRDHDHEDEGGRQMPAPMSRFEYKGRELTADELLALPEAAPARESGVKRVGLLGRLRNGMSIEQALALPKGAKLASPAAAKRPRRARAASKPPPPRQPEAALGAVALHGGA